MGGKERLRGLDHRTTARLSLQNAATQGRNLLQIAVTDAASTRAME
jgi:hypothetical protein